MVQKTCIIMLALLLGASGWGQAPLRDTAPQFGLAEIMAPGVTYYNTRDVYREKTGKDAPECNPAMPAKYWSMDVPEGTKWVTISVPVVLSGGTASVQTLSIPAALSRAVNIPKAQQASGEPSPAEELRFPIQPLREDEVLVNTPFGIVVRNTTRFLPMTDPVQNEILTLLRKIAAKLGL